MTNNKNRIIKKLDEKRAATERRFPLVTALFATFGFVSILYGFEKFIDSIDFLADKPLLIFLFGFTILAITGSVYKKLN